jgi:stage IV sporulation protein FB
MWVTIARLNGFKVRVHASVLLALALAGFGGFTAGVVVAYLALIVVHELGHVAVAAACGARITGLDLSLLAGTCRWQGQVRPLERVAIAWGGVAAQALVFFAVLGALLFLGFPERTFLSGLAMVLALVNPVVMFVNLLPLESLDGHTASKLFPMLRARRHLARLEMLPKMGPVVYGVMSDDDVATGELELTADDDVIEADEEMIVTHPDVLAGADFASDDDVLELDEAVAAGLWVDAQHATVESRSQR